MKPIESETTTKFQNLFSAGNNKNEIAILGTNGTTRTAVTADTTTNHKTFDSENNSNSVKEVNSGNGERNSLNGKIIGIFPPNKPPRDNSMHNRNRPQTTAISNDHLGATSQTALRFYHYQQN